MKNGAQKSSSKGLQKFFHLKPFWSRLKEYSEEHKDDMRRTGVLVVLSLISALAIQERLGIDRFAGSFLMAAVILFIFYKDIKRYKPGYMKDYKMLLLLGLLVTGTLLLGRIFEYLLSGLHRGLSFPISNAFVYGIPIPVGAMLVKLIFDFHTSIIFSFAISLLTGIWFNDPLYTVYVFIGSLTASFSVMRCRRRSALIKGGVYVSAVNIVTVGIILLLKGNLISPISPSSFLFAAISGIMVSATVSIMLPVIEYVFGTTTDISLVELLDLDQPLMRNLMIAAPGTYHHSVIVGNLAEAAAEAVGANPLLARVTAYYHDIGKMKMPEYFVENQAGMVSKHERLMPHMSSMILTSHVKEGVELARQYKLPRLVIDIIQQHHGTSLITYFYQKAIEQASSVSQENYRYPGPRPQTRVAALVMMADAVEAASRTLTEPTPARISALVDRIINNIFLDGQIDECELTLKDISEVKKRFTYILTSIFHRRIEYPELDVKAIPHRTEKTIAEAGASKNPGVSLTQDNGNNNKEQPKTDKDKPAENREHTEESPEAPGS
ncbi:MAG: HDIG domain-containing protein [Nitrospirae bacterium]|nr:HDIG domain-containing protein [Nitrospirota bacterium]MCL5063022.1 HDIG domain-containing protein [Nitrospirota bacterium]MDA8215643.1 HDIG domain-containing protein [Nitrospiraceae bacterium]MDA8338774.1 HDIG domain-containing protein [Nitrospiraceae bacterium]